MTGPLLFERYPQLQSMPWISLANLPTPIEPLDVGPGVQAWVKRDDLTAALYGGNKVRKLEFLLAYARARGARRLITAGAAGSHHALATAVYGRELGFDTTLVLFPQPLTSHVKEVLLTNAALNAELRWTRRMTLVPSAVTAARLAHWRERTHTIAPGGSDAVGTLGYVNAMLELGQQIEEGALPVPDAIAVAAGTLGTTAGIAIGCALLGLPIEIVATRITSRLVTNELALHGLIRDTCALLQRYGLDVPARQASRNIRLSHEQVGSGYGQPTETAQQAQAAFSFIGLPLDITYTAKAAADFMVLAAGRAGANLLFWHTLSATMPKVVAPPLNALPAAVRAYLAG